MKPRPAADAGLLLGAQSSTVMGELMAAMAWSLAAVPSFGAGEDCFSDGTDLFLPTRMPISTRAF